MSTILIKNAKVVNEHQIKDTDILIQNGFISRIAQDIHIDEKHTLIDAKGKYLLPGVIDDQVHFREPGLTHKGDIYTESRAAVAGGITTFMEMPNTVPNTLTQDLLEQKYQIASRSSLANYSFYMGVSNDNLEEALRTDGTKVCGLKVFMGSSTGNMLVDNEKVLEGIFSKAPLLIATHCEDEATIRANTQAYKEKYGEEVPWECHPEIRSEEACYLSSSMAVGLAKKWGSRLHILHISTAKELELFDNQIPLTQKRITAEACIHHLWFSDEDYKNKGAFIKWNPAVKKASDREAIRNAVIDGRIDVIATDHAPHTLEEKKQSYFKAPSGGPLVQHALPAMLDLHLQGHISLELIVERMCHAPATLFQIDKRGYIREGYWADLVLVDLEQPWEVSKENILYKCGWSPFEGHRFGARVSHTIVSGRLAWAEGKFVSNEAGQRLSFSR